MAVDYRSRNKLVLIAAIRKIALGYMSDDRSFRWIWKNKIYPVYCISYSTFMNYMGATGVEKKLRQIE